MVNYEGLLDEKRFISEIKAVHKIDKNLGVQVYSDSTVLPCIELQNGESGGGVIDSDGDFINESTVHNGSHTPYHVDGNNIQYSDETVIYFGMLIGIWGHCISDCIKRAWFFYSKEYKEKYKNTKIIYIASQGSLHNNFIDLLRQLDINIDDFVEVKEATRFKKIIIPDSSFFLDDEGIEHFTNEYKLCIDKIKEKYRKQPDEVNKKVYYSHRNVRGFNNDIGEKKLEEYFIKNGFDIIHPERLKLSEQLELLSKCAVFAASDGSSSHNSIFLPENAEVIIIPRSPYLTFHQLALNELYEGQNIFYIDASLSILCKGDRPTRGPFFYYVSKKLIEHIEKREFSEDEDWIRQNFYDFEKYLKSGFYLENNRSCTAYSPYTELAFYYFNKYLFQQKMRKRWVCFKRYMYRNAERIRRKVFNVIRSR